MAKKLVLILAILLAVPGLALAEKRLGLLIGNDSYLHVPKLEKARNDANALSETLTSLGFEVTEVLDADRREMNRAIAGFTARLQPGDTALVFFAGHGVEIDGENYLLPTDIEAPDTVNEDFVKFESIALSDLLLRVQNTGARTSLMFIDACRDNPFASTTGRSIGGTRGLARVTAPEGTFVVFSAGARQQALDRLSGQDDDPNSVFTRILLPKIQVEGLELRQLVSQVRVEVRDLALMQSHQQFPAYYDELLGQFYFRPTGAVPIPPPPVANVSDSLQSDFARARSIHSIVAYEAFLERYEGEDALEVDIARRELAALRVVVTPEPSEPPADPPKPVPTADPRKEIIRSSQQRLNALGCNAGGADGVVGPRTRQAFQDFIDATKADLKPSDLGSQAALDRLKQASGTVCTPKPVATASPTVTQTGPLPLTGAWSFTAKCPLLISTKGTTTYSALGGGRYSVVTKDNIGNVGRGTATELDGGSLKVQISWASGIRDSYTARIGSDRRTITGTNSLGCRFTNRKQ